MFIHVQARRCLWILGLAIMQFNCDKGESMRRPTATPSGAPATATPPAPVPTTAPATTRSAAEARSLEQKLYGTWIANDVDAKLGQVKVKLTFRQEGPMKLAAWSDIPFVGQVRDKTATYEVNGNVISSGAIRGGTSVEYWFEGDDLIIRYKDGKTVRFDRQ
jgi:hypothetical protein